MPAMLAQDGVSETLSIKSRFQRACAHMLVNTGRTALLVLMLVLIGSPASKRGMVLVKKSLLATWSASKMQTSSFGGTALSPG